MLVGFTDAVYRRIARPILWRFSPDSVHHGMVSTCYAVSKIPGFARLVSAMYRRKYPELYTEWQGMDFSSPLGLSAGLDKNGQMPLINRAIGFGFSEVGSVTPKPCAGNPHPWFYRLPKEGSLVVNAGLPNDGAEVILRRLTTYKNRLQDFPVIMSLAKANTKEVAEDDACGVEEYVAGMRMAKDSPQVAMFELNISCPNAFGGETFTTPELLEQLLAKTDTVTTDKPILVKLPSDLSWKKLDALLKVIVKHRVAGVTATNLLKDRTKLKPGVVSDDTPGNLSGRPLQPLSNDIIRSIYKNYGDKLTIFGVGGVFSAADAYEKIRLGASFVELVTGLIFDGPALPAQINKDLVALLKKDGYSHISEAVGVDA